MNLYLVRDVMKKYDETFSNSVRYINKANAKYLYQVDEYIKEKRKR